MPTWSIVYAAMPYYATAVLVAIWATSVVWTYRDMQARSKNIWSRYFAAAFVGVLTVPGMLIYWFMRPRETLQDNYARALEEEALLQEIERTGSCPHCGQSTQKNWQICPHCHTQLRRSCHSCKTMLELDWSRCPSCLAVQTDTHVPQPAAYSLRDAAPQQVTPWPEEERDDDLYQPATRQANGQSTYDRYAKQPQYDYAAAEVDYASLENLDEF